MSPFQGTTPVSGLVPRLSSPIFKPEFSTPRTLVYFHTIRNIVVNFVAMVLVVKAASTHNDKHSSQSKNEVGINTESW